MRKTFLFLCILFILPFTAFAQEGAPAADASPAAAPSIASPIAPPIAEIAAPMPKQEVQAEKPAVEIPDFAIPQTVSHKLERFGAELFRLPATTFAPVTAVPVGPDYILGPGDEVIIDIWGMIDAHYQTVIDHTGAITLPKIGRIHLWGLSYQEAKELLTAQLNKYYLNVQSAFTLGNLRTIKVFVLGEAVAPGGYEVSSLATLFQALYLAGGPNSRGSMRYIKLWRNNKVIAEVDLYHFLLSGDNKEDIKLQSQDTIFIPLAEKVVGITGSVRRPAIYELKEEKTLSDLINLAGGLTVFGRLTQVQVERVLPFAKKQLIDLNLAENPELKEFPLYDQDLVKVFSIDPQIYNEVTISGSVHNPGGYAWQEGFKLSQILTATELLPQTDLSYAEIERITAPTKREILTFKPEEVISGKADLLLQPQDTIRIFTQLKKSETITLLGEVARPETYQVISGERLSSVLVRAGGFTPNAFLEGAVFTRESLRIAQEANRARFARMQQELLLKEMAPLAGEKGQLEALVAQQEAISLLYSKMPLGRIALSLAPPEKLKGTPSDLVLEYGDLLFVPKPPFIISVVGAVNNQGSVIYEPGKDLEWYIDNVGGYNKYADQRNSFIIHANGMADQRFTRLQKISQGDTIFVPEQIRINRWAMTKDIFSMFYQFALPVAAFVK